MQKNLQITAHIFWIFTVFHSYVGSKSNLHPRTEISAVATLTPKSSIAHDQFRSFMQWVRSKQYDSQKLWLTSSEMYCNDYKL